MSTLPEFMVRVKLPSSSAYHSSPSGDTEYEDAYKKAIADALPPGFEVRWPRMHEKWPVDSEGYTYVRLYATDEKTALAHYIDRVKELESHLDRIRIAVG
jgi:hypothetical protein